MPADRPRGMDHDHYAWSPIVSRPVLRWPDGSRIALCVILNLEHLEWAPPADAYQPPGLYSFLAMQRPSIELWSLSQREYGHRVGIFRLLGILARHGIRPTVAIDAATALNYPYLVDHLRGCGCDFIAHGIAATQMITARMSEDAERRYIAETMAVLTGTLGATPAGWHGPEYGESARTPRLLAEAGLRYVCDWVNDDQPYRLKTPSSLYALPVLLELDDVFAMRDRRFRVDEYCDQIKAAFDTLYREGEKTGRVLALNLHPWLAGQPFRARFLDRVLAHVVRDGVWKATGAEIIESFARQ